jgi:CRP/FNR family cyclic AMP-dependent transcriptional regulator
MISPELLRRYPFFGFLNDAQLKAVAMIAEEITFKSGETILAVGKAAEALYFLIDGNAALYYIVAAKDNPDLRKELHISDMNPGEIFGISALIEPYQYTGTIRVAGLCRVLKIEAAALRALCEVDQKMAYALMRQTARAAMERLESTRVQLAAERA